MVGATVMSQTQDPRQVIDVLVVKTELGGHSALNSSSIRLRSFSSHGESFLSLLAGVDSPIIYRLVALCYTDFRQVRARKIG